MEGFEGKRVQRLLEVVLGSRTNCKYEDLERLLVALGFTIRRPSGSHRFFKRGNVTFSVPERKPVKVHYVDEVLAFAQSLLGKEK